MQQKITIEPTTSTPLFINEKDVEAIHSWHLDVWKSGSQPHWPTRYISFLDNDRIRRRKLIRALTKDQNDRQLFHLGMSLFYCSEHSRCKSPLCNYCRTNYQNHYQKFVLNKFSPYNRQNIYFITILNDLTYTPETHIPAWKDPFKRRINNVINSSECSNNIELFGALEIDAKDTSKYSPEDKAYQTLMHYGLEPDKAVAFMPHFHGIIAADGSSQKEVKNLFKKRFQKEYQVSVGRLWLAGTKEENLAQLARYIFKFRYQFANNIMRAKPSYGDIFDPKTLCAYARAVHNTKGQNGLRRLTITK